MHCIFFPDKGFIYSKGRDKYRWRHEDRINKLEWESWRRRGNRVARRWGGGYEEVGRLRHGGGDNKIKGSGGGGWKRTRRRL